VEGEVVDISFIPRAVGDVIGCTAIMFSVFVAGVLIGQATKWPQGKEKKDDARHTLRG
jgi:NhaP-type Na+/H+ or K+/H+ antiporter